ncbi:nuclease domain-containing protein [Desulfonatronum thioautotrophicum]|uniref:nuclease domain-containing protein n=1 Tax=Desulfonatronum thioautotrophicum TaxID=617001 RepID=UPI0005EAD937|nr:nuclease domain-containing protein [Desulfonatronum thioautotrophicum]
MPVMDSPLGPVETELALRQDWPLLVQLNKLGRYFVKCFGDVPDSVRQAPCVIQTFPDNLPAGQSYSYPLRPDITIEQCGRRLILDAKFKGTGSGFYGIEAEDGTIQRWREEEIDKMHAYRDAIAGVQGAFILYPGLETAIFTPWDQTFPGVGALALRPGEDAVPLPEQGVSVGRILDIRAQLPLNKDDFLNLIKCPLSLNQYLDILRQKSLLD